MRRALLACLSLALGSGPIGLFLVMRRMSLVGDAMSHAVLPGVALGFIYAGLSLSAMSLGGLIAGLVVALLSGLATRLTALREDASFAAFYLLSLALGVLLVTQSGNTLDLMHILFGSVLAIDQTALYWLASVSNLSLLVLALIYRPLLLESVDPVFLQSVAGRGLLWHMVFLVLVVLNLVAGFQALGTLMSVGLMMLPAICARLWSSRMTSLLLLTISLAFLAGLGGLLVSYHFALPSGPAIILLAGFFYLISLLIAPVGGILPRYLRVRHFES